MKSALGAVWQNSTVAPLLAASARVPAVLCMQWRWIAWLLAGPVLAGDHVVPTRPNVLFIVIDDLNDWVNCLNGHPHVQTPHIDRLAAAGTLFTNAHCQAPLCNPSRTSVLTGLRPSTTGTYSLNAWFRNNPQYRDALTLPKFLSQQGGYTTLTTGKVFHDGFPPDDDPQQSAEFDVPGYKGRFGPLPAKKFVSTVSDPPFPLFTYRHEPRLVDWGVFPERDELQEDWSVTDWAITQIEAGVQQPFFLAVGLRHPHFPLHATQPWYDLYPEQPALLPPRQINDRDDTPRFSWYLHWNLPEPRLAWLQRHNQDLAVVRGYLASVSFVDHLVGRLLDALERTGLCDHTLVVLWSDHGFHLGEKEITGKNSLWERATRVPLIFAGPGIESGAVCDQPVELLDLYPTLAELCGLPVDSSLEGASLVPQLRDALTPREWPAITTHGPGNHAARDSRWRYIRYADGSEELYDMQQDPHEWSNLAQDPRYAATKAELAAWLPTVSTPPLANALQRLVEFDGQQARWEGHAIDADDVVPPIFQPHWHFRTKRLTVLAATIVLTVGTIVYRHRCTTSSWERRKSGVTKC